MSGWARSRGCDIALFDTVGSTHQVGTRIMAASPRRGRDCWILALHQRNGRGRYGRRWESPYGAGVYASHRLSVPRGSVPILPQLVGVALCEGLKRLGFECRLKWPNDLLLRGKKVGGILLQARGSAELADAVASFGINHHHRVEDLPRPDATSLDLEGAPASLTLAALTSRLADQLEHELDAFAALESGGAADQVLERYQGWSSHELGDRLAVNLGERVLEGEFAGFAVSGELRLRHEGGEQLLSSGEVEL